MRILHVDHSPIVGGAERSVLELARAQLARGHDVRVAVGRRGDFSALLTANAVPWHDLGWSARYVSTSRAASSLELLARAPDVIRAVMSLRGAIAEWRPDVVQAHTRKAQLIATFAVTRFDVALIWHIRDALPSRAPLRALIRRAIRRAHHAVALSDWLRQSYAESGATPRSGRIGIVPSGIDPAELAVLRTPWLAGEREPVIGYVGQVAQWKGPHLLVDAAEHMTDVRATFRIIGGVWFPASERAYGQWLRRRIASSPASDRVEWLPATARPAEAFEQIDVLAHTSLEPEPFGRVLVEAAVARRPIVALRHGSTTELLDESTAVFAAHPDGTSMAAAIKQLIDDPDRARALATQAVLSAASFTPDAVAGAMDAEYASLRS